VEKTRDLRITADGGQTWRVVASQAVSGALECATMTDGNRGWAVNHQGQVFTTYSAGASWTRIADLAALSDGNFAGANQIEFINETDGWIREFLSIWRTRDGGVTWQKILSVLTPGVKGEPARFYPIDENTLGESGSDGQDYITKDSRDWWKIETLVPDNADFTDVWFVDKQKGWLSGYIGGNSSRPLLFETKDGGASWEEIPSADNGIRIWSICVVDNEGWLAGHRRSDNGEAVSLTAVLLHTNDGGRHWTPVQLGSGDEPFFSLVRFTDKEHGWVVGRDNLYRTQDGGQSWQRVLSLPPVS